jgi:hypothetical protein
MPARAASFTSSGELLRPKGTIDFIPLPIHRLDLTMHYGRRIDKSIEGEVRCVVIAPAKAVEKFAQTLLQVAFLYCPEQPRP